MRIGKLVFRMRWKQADLLSRGKQASFGNFVAAAGELALAMSEPPTREMCFIIPLGATVNKATSDNNGAPSFAERFGVVVCLKADVKQNDKYGFLVYDRVHSIRSEIVNAFHGWQMAEAESIIQYSGENLVDYSPSYLWYQYTFDFVARLQAVPMAEGVVEGDVVDYGFQDIHPESPTDLDRIYSQYILRPDFEGRLPLDPTQDLPLPDGFPDVSLPNIAQFLERTVP